MPVMSKSELYESDLIPRIFERNEKLCLLLRYARWRVAVSFDVTTFPFREDEVPLHGRMLPDPGPLCRLNAGILKISASRRELPHPLRRYTRDDVTTTGYIATALELWMSIDPALYLTQWKRSRQQLSHARTTMAFHQDFRTLH